jgi:NTE family protein
MATVAIPGIMEPVNYNRMLLTDGMVTSLTPAEEVRRMGATYVIAVEVMPRLRRGRAFSSGLDIMERANAITSRKLHGLILKEADLVISPPVKNIYWANFDKMDYCIKAGESASFDIKSRMK